MHIVGNAQSLIEALEEARRPEHRRDAVVIALSVSESDPVHSWGWLEATQVGLSEALRRFAPRILVLVLDGPLPEDQISAAARELLEETNTVSTNLLGRTITAMAVTVSRADDRSAAAHRIGEHLLGRTDLGNGAVVAARRLTHESIRDIVLEEVL